MDREALIEATRREWRSTPAVWSHSDCVMSDFNYVRAITGFDGGAKWRDTYRDEAGALAALAAGGGLEGFDRQLRKAGAKPVSEPERGDVIMIDCGHEVAGLCLGDVAMFRLQRGAIEVDMRRVKVLGAWRCD